MQKIMFNDRYGLTQAVLEGRKTMTRRICKEQHWAFSDVVNAQNGTFHFELPKYKAGEIVAVAQSYRDAGIAPDMGGLNPKPGWSNKMFVRAYDMPHRVRITGIRCERLQDISDEDCMKEGIQFIKAFEKYYFERFDREDGFYFDISREAFSVLIDKVSGRGTWQSNPWVWVYEFELVR